MNFYSDGTTIGVSLTIWGLLFVAYILFEFYNLYKTRMLFIHKLFIYYKVKKEINKILPPWWRIKRIRLSMWKSSKWLNEIIADNIITGCIRVPVDFELKDPFYVCTFPNNTTGHELNEEVIVDNFGRIIDKLNNLELADISIPENLKKEYKRDSILNELLD